MCTSTASAIDALAQRLTESLGDVARELAEIKDELILIGDATQRARYFTENETYGGSE